MNTTVAVALITALSTLTGAATTGCLALLTGRAQLRVQQRNAELDRIEQHADNVRGTRRYVYLGFIHQLTQIEEMFDRDLWVRTAFGKDDSISPGEIMYTATARMHKLASQLDFIQLEGPAKVSDAAGKVYSSLDAEVMRLMALASPEARDMEMSGVEMYTLWKTTSQARKEVKDKFLRVAREALKELPEEEV
jgi:hypothetical protein